jgi:hypothetical protein
MRITEEDLRRRAELRLERGVDYPVSVWSRSPSPPKDISRGKNTIYACKNKRKIDTGVGSAEMISNIIEKPEKVIVENKTIEKLVSSNSELNPDASMDSNSNSNVERKTKHSRKKSQQKKSKHKKDSKKEKKSTTQSLPSVIQSLPPEYLIELMEQERLEAERFKNEVQGRNRIVDDEYDDDNGFGPLPVAHLINKDDKKVNIYSLNETSI